MNYEIQEIYLRHEDCCLLINGKEIRIPKLIADSFTIDQLKSYAAKLYKEKFEEKCKPPAFRSSSSGIKILVVSRNEITVMRGTMTELLEDLRNYCLVQKVLWAVIHTADCEYSLRFKRDYLKDDNWRKTFYTFCLRATLAD